MSSWYFRRSEDALEPVKEAVARKKEKGDVYVVWLQQGIRNEEARKLAEENEISSSRTAACIMSIRWSICRTSSRVAAGARGKGIG